MKCCRFDDTETRKERKNDKFTPIREPWDMFAKRSMHHYNIGECVTVDEMLLKFRGRSGFCQFMLSKPGRYGNKFWLLADCANHYRYNIIPCLGIRRQGSNQSWSKSCKRFGCTYLSLVPEVISFATGT